jgi:hypothetical protein
VSTETGGVTVKQVVTAIPDVRASGTAPSEIALGQFAIGTYFVSYIPFLTASGPLPNTLLSFSVRPPADGADIDIEPLEPVALEPVEAHFSYVDGCQYVSGFRVVDGGFRIELSNNDSNPISCDSISTGSVTIGAFPPGSYRSSSRGPNPRAGPSSGRGNSRSVPAELRLRRPCLLRRPICPASGRVRTRRRGRV